MKTRYFEIIQGTEENDFENSKGSRTVYLQSPPEFDRPPDTVSFREIVGRDDDEQIVYRHAIFMREDLWDDEENMH